MINGILIDIGFVFGPIVGFAPQIYKGIPQYRSELSILTIIGCILKLFDNKNAQIDKVLQYQFYTTIIMHIYLIRLHSLKQNQHRINFFGFLFYEGVYYTHLMPAMMLFLLTLKVFDSFGFSYLYMPISTAMDIAISLLHLDIYARGRSKPLELFITWLIGDITKLILLIRKYDTPFWLILGTCIQMIINLIVAVL